jgi:endogenous inhibitor of DNA gyrase (YacG/DUF329 family)
VFLKAMAAEHSNSVKLVVCPTCGGDSVYSPANAFRPFCSARCKNIDLGAWASEDFRVPSKTLPEDLTDDQQP